MTQPDRLSSAHYSEKASPSPVLRVVRGLFRASASLELAVVLIAAYMAVLIWATMVMSHWYADSELKHGIYLSPWFAALNALLALNVLNAALIRWPWSRRQWPFVTIHAGILVLLAGSWISFRFGIDGTLSVFEGTAERRVYTGDWLFRLRIRPSDSRGSAPSAVVDSSSPSAVEEIDVPFRSGPFNWRDYGSVHASFPWSWVVRDRGVIYDRNGIRLEVIDYLHDSLRRPIPRLTLSVESQGRAGLGHFATDDQRVALEIAPAPRGHGSNRPFGMGARADLQNGVKVLLWMTAEAEETNAFLNSAPEGPLGKRGQIVLYHQGRSYRFLCDELLGAGRTPLGDDGPEIELVGMNPRVMGFAVPAVQLMVYHRDGSAERMLLYAALPHWNHHDRRHGVYGTYWLDAAAAEADETVEEDRAGQVRRDTQAPRVDILQGYDGRLYYRSWLAPEQCHIGPWPQRSGAGSGLVGSELRVFADSRFAARLRIDEYLHASRPDWTVEPLPYERNPQRIRQPRARVRLSFGGESREFWLAGPSGELSDDQRFTWVGAAGSLEITLQQQAEPLGFEVYLHRFIKKLDPGQRRPAYYASEVDFRLLDGEEGRPKMLRQNVLIELNRPVDVLDPSTGRSYRFFQASYEPPRRPGDPLFEQLVGLDDPRGKLNRSIFSVSYDPGRAWKYFGSLLIVGGIMWLYYGRRPVGARPSEENRQ